MGKPALLFVAMLLGLSPPASAQHELHRGTGDDVININRPEQAPALLLINGNSNRGNFAIWALDEAGGQTDLLVNTTARYQGRVLTGPDTEGLEINAESAWSVAVFQVAAAATPISSGATVSGDGDDVLWIDGSAATAQITGNAAGENFAVWAMDARGLPLDLLVNTIEEYTGRVRIPSGTRLLAVSASGSWTITLN